MKINGKIIDSTAEPDVLYEILGRKTKKNK
jgi:hypothetical protein